MFYYLRGELAYREGNICVIDCGGVGYKLTISAITADELVSKLGKQVKIYTHMAVRDDGIELFGFGSTEERECFNKLISVSGIGPKVALSILTT
jgi:Holliday junction DNA helicase RuvA